MANYERHFYGNFDDALRFCEETITSGSMTLSLEEATDFQQDNVRIAVRVYERFSYLGGNRVSMTLVMTGAGSDVHVFIATTGGSQAMFFKINTWGEENFLSTIDRALEDYITGRR